MIKTLPVMLVLLMLWPAAASAQVETDLELVLLADATGSIDDAEILFQRRGYAEAITSQQVLNAIANNALGSIAVTYVEWGNDVWQDVVVEWTLVDGADSAQSFADKLMAAPRRARGRNAIGSALLFGKALIEENDFAGLRRVIDLSADSANNWNGPPIGFARQQVLDAGIVINGLAILCRQCSGRPVSYDLEAAFAERIIGGPGSFIITAENAANFAVAVRRKLVLEIGDTAPASRYALRNNAPDTLQQGERQ
ncbi:DUF1194 domain-containing protein [Nitratireductor sp. XY-223]|uniref:DUF1194 domain-containing protein n=1 Tax=Nitratireductor sp. XY-223 TaxID=2561926 RepID=UPI0010AA3D1D|nr:DUF1194 domain-containing protein [Nitratireductor sp. XY-223]